MPRREKRQAVKANLPPKLPSTIEDELAFGDTEASETFPVKTSALRTGSYVMMGETPCKIVNLTTSNPGKHGHAKAHIVGLAIFTGKRHETISPTHAHCEVPNVTRKDFQVVDISHGGSLTLMDAVGTIDTELDLPEDAGLRNKIQSLFNNEEEFMVTVQAAMGRRGVCGVKNMSRK